MALNEKTNHTITKTGDAFNHTRDRPTKTTHNLKTGTWTGEDHTGDSNGPGHSSGEEDGSTDTDEDDCEIWFDIIDNGDTDGDGLKYYQEVFVLMTSPTAWDSDGNGIGDGLEDFDGDFLLNVEEQLWQCDPWDVDTDGDGVYDYVETVYPGALPTDKALPGDDNDEDGLTESIDPSDQDPWDPGVYILYDERFNTHDYDGWDGNIATSDAVVRRGNRIVIGGPNMAGIDVSGVGSALTDLTPAEGGRGFWIISVPEDCTIGKYTITLQSDGTSDTMNLYIIFQIPEGAPKGYVYDPNSDRDEKGMWRAIDIFGGWGWLGDCTYELFPYDASVYKKSIAVARGACSPVDAAYEIWSFTNEILRWRENYGNKYSEVTDILNEVSITDIYANNYEEVMDGQCMDFAAVSCSLYRAIGVPSRLVSGFHPNIASGLQGNVDWYESYHVWTEVLVEEDSALEWYVYDSTDKNVNNGFGSGDGTICPRNEFLDDVDRVTCWDSTGQELDITDAYIT